MENVGARRQAGRDEASNGREDAQGHALGSIERVALAVKRLIERGVGCSWSGWLEQVRRGGCGDQGSFTGGAAMTMQTDVFVETDQASRDGVCRLSDIGTLFNTESKGY